MDEAEKLFNQVWRGFANRQAFVLSFRIASAAGLDAARAKIRAEKVRFVAELMAGGEYDKLLIDKAAFFKEMPPEKLIEGMTEQTIRQAQIAVDAASIVFAHSFVDGAVFDCCRVTALVDPKDWEVVLDQRQVKLSEMRDAKYEDVLKRKLDEHLEQLGRESLLKKADLLFVKCKPPDKWSPMHDYEYDRKRLERLDNYRHSVIHGAELGRGIGNADAEVDYLMRTGLFFTGLLNLRYGLKVDPFFFTTGKERPALG